MLRAIVTNLVFSCEGQADWYGAAVVMRKTFPPGLELAPVPEYLDVMFPAIDQLHALLSRGVLLQPHDSVSSKEGCVHPPADCRKQTYERAMELRPKPTCASIQLNGLSAQLPSFDIYAKAGMISAVQQENKEL